METIGNSQDIVQPAHHRSPGLRSDAMYGVHGGVLDDERNYLFSCGSMYDDTHCTGMKDLLGYLRVGDEVACTVARGTVELLSDVSHRTLVLVERGADLRRHLASMDESHADQHEKHH